MHDVPDPARRRVTSRTPRRAAPVELREIGIHNVREVLALNVTPSQTNFVAGVRDSLQEAETTPDGFPWYRAVYADDTVVGFVMLSDNIPPGNPELVGPYYLWRLLIDHNHQGNGYGAGALDRCVEYVRSRPGGRELLTSVAPGEGGPLPFYLHYGFVETTDTVDGEQLIRLPL